jgi:hypothetical protein
MQGALRIRRGARGALAGRAAGPVDPWLARLVKLVPAEIVAVYLAGRPLAADRFAELWPVVCLALVVIVRAWGSSDRRGPQWISVAIAAASFVLWVHATGGRFPGWTLAADVAGLAVLVWTTLVPVFWRGDEPA